MDLDTYYRLVKYLDDLVLPDDLNQAQLRSFKNKSRYFIVRNGLLYKKNSRNPQRPLRVLKPSEVEPILYSFHGDPLAGHFGFGETYRAISEKYFWPQMGDDIKRYVQSCDTCQRRQRPIKTEPLHPIKVGQPFDRIGMDIVGPLPKTRQGNQYIVVATEYLTKWPEARALPNAKAISVVSFFYEDIICRHGCPKVLLTDQGTHFVNEMLNSLCEQLGVRHQLSTTYHPQTNGLVERFNRTLCEMLAKYSNEHQDDWDKFLPSALFAYRTIRQNTTRYEPFYLTYGREAVLPIELEIPGYPSEDDRSSFEELYFWRLNHLIGKLTDDRQQAQQNIMKAQEKQKIRYDQTIREHTYRIGDKVLLKNFRARKLDPKWNGPYYVHDIRPHGTYKLRTIDGKLRKKLAHADQIRPYYDRLESQDGEITRTN
jgi:hypothetical protein